MAWVYILHGASGRHYIGSTTDLPRRLEQHHRGHTSTTRRLGGDLQLAAAAEFATLAEARELERILKPIFDSLKNRSPDNQQLRKVPNGLGTTFSASRFWTHIFSRNVGGKATPAAMNALCACPRT